ncbi:MAG: hypothetical protein DCF26_23725 [Burkholderiales bacterium]|nr:MAG: hypothetical protein DCF26_23725 [Burkholderiales bacterium]
MSLRPRCTTSQRTGCENRRDERAIAVPRVGGPAMAPPRHIAGLHPQAQPQARPGTPGRQQPVAAVEMAAEGFDHGNLRVPGGIPHRHREALIHLRRACGLQQRAASVTGAHETPGVQRGPLRGFGGGGWVKGRVDMARRRHAQGSAVKARPQRGQQAA